LTFVKSSSVAAIFAAVLLATGAATRTRAATPPAGFEDHQIVDTTAGGGAVSPAGIAYEPGTGALFILEKGDGSSAGSARVRRRDAVSGLVTTALTIDCVDSVGERGLLGIAFDPDYLVAGNANRRVYLYYTRAAGDAGSPCQVPSVAPGSYNWVVRTTESGGVLTGEEVLLQGPSLGSVNHQGGTIRVGTDKTLFISMGDNATRGESPPKARDLNDLRGKILRINRDGSVPPDNPFVGQAGKRPEIWAWGLRNPFRFGIDEAAGTLYIGDVGENAWEEIDAGIAGADYGWPCFEGPAPLVACSPPPAGDTQPIYAYDHTLGNAIIGGPVYRATAFPLEYQGAYFFGDYGSAWIRRGKLGQDGALTDVELFLQGAFGIADLAVSPAGCLTWVSITGQGIHDVCYVGGTNGQPQARAAAAPVSGLSPLAVQFDGTASSDPDGQPLGYSWNFGDATVSQGAAPLKLYTGNGVRLATLTVDDGQGATNSTDASPPLKIVVGNRAPSVNVAAPAPGARYSAGDTIAFSGSATDPEDGVLPASAFAWTVVFHHETHTHPFLGPIVGVTSGSFTIPASGEESTHVYYQVNLKVTDSGAPLGSAGALTQTVDVNVGPRVTNIGVAAIPAGAGLVLSIDQVPGTAPWSLASVAGFPRTLSAPASQTVGGTTWQFVSWSDGGAASHGIAAPVVPATYIATYQCVAGCQFAPSLQATRSGADAAHLTWGSLACASAYDVTRGSVSSLRSTSGNFGAAAQACVASGLHVTTLDDPQPTPAGGSWFLVRAVGCGGAGTYDESGVPSQAGSRDAEIAASPGACADGSGLAPSLTATQISPGTARLTWTSLACAASYDVVRGDLGALRGSAGDFGPAVTACLANDLGVTTLDDGAPAPAGGAWYLTRGNGCGGAGTYDESGVLSQQETRDPELLESAAVCP
jgi:glucose/arabinose dehydrogenase/PKD repeat protein